MSKKRVKKSRKSQIDEIECKNPSKHKTKELF